MTSTADEPSEAISSKTSLSRGDAATSGDVLPPRTALILFASETGTAEDAAEALGRLFERERWDVDVKPMDAVQLPDLLKPTFTIFVCSTTGQGDIPANGRLFWKSLLRKRLPIGCLRSLRFTSFGFGDSSYVKFNWAARKLHKRLEQLGAQDVVGRGEADEQHDEGVDGAFLPWCRDLKNWLEEQYPLPAEVAAIPDDDFLEPKFILQQAGADLPNLSTLSIASTPISAPTQACNPPPLLLSYPDAHLTRVVENKRITPSTHFQDVRHISLCAPHGLDYAPGDTLTIYPKNFPADVQSLISLQGWDDIADVPLIITPNPARTAPGTNGIVVTSPSSAPIDPALPTPLTLRNLLLHTLDLNRIPNRHFLALCSQFTTDESHRERLREFSDPAFTDEYYDYVTRPRRSVLEVLADFDTVKIPWRYLLTVIPKMRGRQFSIASSQRFVSGARSREVVDGGDSCEGSVDENVSEGTKIDLLIALVKYRTVLKKVREGTCSRYLATLEPGTMLNCTLQRASWDVAAKNYEMLRRPILAVAAGTGVAPMRSLMQERAAVFGINHGSKAEAGGEPGKAVLVFGNRNRSADFFYADEWSKYGIPVLEAWSREKREKVYVQDKIRENPGLVWELVGPEGVVAKLPAPGAEASADENKEAGKVQEAVGGGGTLFICGSSGKMPISVRAAVIAALVKCGMDEDAAERHLKDMEKRGRLVQETW